MVSKDAERELARSLRAQGLSLNEIVARVSAAKSSVSVWVRDIRLTPAQGDALVAKQQANASKIVGWGRSEREARWRAFHRQAEEEYGLLSPDPDFMFGLALYAGLTVSPHLVRSVSRGSSGKKRGRQPYGTCRVQVCSTQLRQKREQWMALSLQS